MEGTRLGSYRLVREIGSGGTATVYLATVEGRAPDLAPGDHVAVKVVHSHLLNQPGFHERFLREVEFGRAIRHDNLVRVFDMDAVEIGHRTVHFLVMQYVEGQTLRALLHELGRVPEDLCLHISREVANALEAIHRAGFVHRDLKPENVLITRDEVVKVMDLGLALLRDEAMRLSETDQFVGSVLYAAPEQFRRGGEDIDGRADLYALGLLLYELATGRHPFVDDDLRVVMQRHLAEKPLPPSVHNGQLSPFLEEFVLALLEKERTDRFSSAAEIIHALEKGENSTWWHDRSGEIRRATREPLRRIRIPRETGLHGREAQVAEFRELWDRVEQGDGRAVILEGEAGIGKSRLVDEFIAGMEAKSGGLHYLYGAYPPGGAATAAGAFSTAYREHFGTGDLEATLGTLLPDTPALVPAFAALLRGEPPPPGSQPLNRDSIQTVFVHATRALAGGRPTVVLVDDLHFAPEEGLSLFAALAHAVAGHPILLVGTTRPGILPAEWISGIELLGHVHHLRLGRLDGPEVESLIADYLGSGEGARRLLPFIDLKADGNPFFVIEILQGLKEDNRLVRRYDGTWEVRVQPEDIRIPDSVKDLVKARISGLSDEDRELLELAACYGYEFDPVIVAEALGRGRVPALKSLGRIERAHRIVRSVGRRYVFDHHQVQEALYEELSELLREEYHAALGETLERLHEKDVPGAVAARTAEHLLRGGRGDRALRHFEGGVSHLLEGYQSEQTVSLLDRFLSSPGLLEGEELVQALLRKASCLDILGRRPERGEALEEARRIAKTLDEPRLKAEVLLELANHRRMTGEHDDAARLIESALEVARRAKDAELEASSLGSLGTILADQGRLDEARELFEKHLEVATAASREGERARALGNLAICRFRLGDLDGSISSFEECLGIFREEGDRRAEMAAVGNLVVVLHHACRYREAQERLELHLSLSRETGYRRGEAMASGNLGGILFSLGDYGGALAAYEGSLEIWNELGLPFDRATALVNCGGIYTQLGRLEEAEELVSEGMAVHREVGHQWGVAEGLDVLGTLYEEQDRWREAEVVYHEALEVRRGVGGKMSTANVLYSLGRLHTRLGNLREARAQLETALTLAEKGGSAPVIVGATALLATLSPEHAVRAREELDRHAERISVHARMEARFRLFEAEGDPDDLAVASRLLDALVESAPPKHRESMLERVRLFRGIREAGAA